MYEWRAKARMILCACTEWSEFAHIAHVRRFLMALWFNGTSALVVCFVSSPREREKRYRRDTRGDEREGQGRKRKMNESEETKEVKTLPFYPTCCKGSRPCPTVSQYQFYAPATQNTTPTCSKAIFRLVLHIYILC